MHMPISKNNCLPSTHTRRHMHSNLSVLFDVLWSRLSLLRLWQHQISHSPAQTLNICLTRKAFLCKCATFVRRILSHGQVSRHHMSATPVMPLLNSSNGESTRWLTFVFLSLSLCLWPFAWSLPAVIKLVIYSKQRYNAVTTSPLSFHKALANVWWEKERVLNGYWSDVIWISFSLFFPPMDVEQGLFV